MDNDREFEHSPLSGSFSRDGEKVDVEIYRYAGTQASWQLVVTDLSSGGCTAWQETFATGREAYGAFLATVETDGMASFTVAPLRARHLPHPPLHGSGAVSKPAVTRGKHALGLSLTG